MDKTVIKWASAILVLITLCGFIGQSAVRLNRVETETEKVSKIEKQMQIVTLYLKLQDPNLYNKAERLAN